MSASHALVWPVFALAGWTFCMLLCVAFRRVTAGLQGHVHPREYTLGESPRVPAAVSLPNRNYMNLLELPVLFYVACLLGLLTRAAPAPFISLAWMYVGLRVVHSLIHITYNHVMHRFAAFATSNAVLLAMWVLLGWTLARTA